MEQWSEAKDGLNMILSQDEEMTLDQRLKVIEIEALLAIGQELSALNPQNTLYRDKDGEERNGWGIKTEQGGPRKKSVIKRLNTQ